MVINYLIFPGLLFTVIAAFLVSYIDRKVTALLQWRVGPPFLQPVWDFLKLLKKETIVPENSNMTVFLIAPVASFSSLILVSTILLMNNIYMTGFVGDVFVVMYLLLIPSIAVMMGGAASANPLASLGASREMKMVLAYELPFILALCVVIIKTGAVNLSEIIIVQQANGMVAGSLSGILAFCVTMICFQSKMAQVPFDLPEAEQEIMGGALIEYSGPPLGLFVLSRWILMAIIPFFTVVLFLGGVGSLWGILKYLLVVVLVILFKNTNPRLRINQTLRLFWGPVTAVAVISVILAFLGL